MLLSNGSIFKVDPNRRYWVVRADGGDFVNHFRYAGQIAVGFIDNLIVESLVKDFYFPQKSLLRAEMMKHFSRFGSGKARFTSHWNQTERFIYEMSIGDWIITPGRDFLQFGRVVGNPRYNRYEIQLPQEFGPSQKTMQYYLRRRVNWGLRIRRTSFPTPIRRSLAANQTIFEVTDHWKAIHHLIFPFFRANSHLNISLRITNPKDIQNISTARLFLFLSEVEAFARYANNAATYDPTQYYSFLKTLERDQKLRAVSQAQFMSEGDVWLSVLENIPNGLLWVYLISSIIIGNKILGFDGFIDLETRHKVRDFILDRWTSNSGESTKTNLGLQLPQHETKELTSSSVDEEEPKSIQKHLFED